MLAAWRALWAAPFFTTRDAGRNTRVARGMRARVAVDCARHAFDVRVFALSNFVKVRAARRRAGEEEA
ncbi:MAG: hypothetical protein DMF67_01940 [Acidobacteria bacterium]|nr:MAG: hypothetical protein DMF66_13165 [Acidobacteriota bacterium]PYS85170.1 MAG: hypothetical protein DMF67_01940 [Acidobacteriota bacterium]